MQIIYKLTIYGEDGNPLTPTSDLHSDPFVISSAPLSGSKAYITGVTKNAGQAEIPDIKWTIGNYYVGVADIRLGSTNDERWLTAFITDGEGRISLNGKKALVEESLDGGSTWAPVFVGKVTETNLDGPLKYTIEIADDAERLKRELFSRYPEFAGVLRSELQRTMIAPIGIENTPTTPRQAIRARRVASEGVFGININFSAARLQVDRTKPFVATTSNRTPYASGRWELQATELLEKYSNLEFVPFTIDGVEQTFYSLNKQVNAIVEITSTDFTTSYGDFILTGFTTRIEETPFGDTEYLDSITVQSRGLGLLDVLNIPSNSDVAFRIFGPNSAQAFEDLPLYITADNPIELLKDVLDGLFDDLYYQDTSSYTPIVYDEANFDAIVTSKAASGNNLEPITAIITETHTMNEFIEQTLLKPYGIGYYLQPVVESGVAKSKMVLFNLDRPVTMPSVEIKDENVITREFIGWTTDNPYRINRTFRVTLPREIGPAATDKKNLVPAYTQENNFIVVDRVALVNDTYTDLSIDPSSTALGPRGLLSFPTDTDQGATNNPITITDNFLRPIIELGNRFGKGVPVLSVTVKRGVYENVREGDYIKTDIQWQPNLGTFKRGGLRIMQVTQRQENGATLQFTLVDSGIFERLPAPTMGTVSVTDRNRLVVPITGSATGSVVRVDYALTNTNSIPAGTSDNWNLLATLDLDVNQAVTASISNLPSNKWVFARARTERVEGSLKLPSTFVSSSGVQTTNIAAPSGLTNTNTTFYTTDISFTPSADYSTEVWTTGNEAGTLQYYTTLPQGTGNATISGLDRAPTTGQVVSIRFVDINNGYSPFATISFNRGTDQNQAPKLAGIFIFTDTFL